MFIEERVQQLKQDFERLSDTVLGTRPEGFQWFNNLVERLDDIENALVYGKCMMPEEVLTPDKRSIPFDRIVQRHTRGQADTRLVNLPGSIGKDRNGTDYYDGDTLFRIAENGKFESIEGLGVTPEADENMLVLWKAGPNNPNYKGDR